MSTLQERIGNDWKEAMKARDPKKNILALIKTEFKNKAIANREGGTSSTDLNDSAALDVLNKMAKQRRESIESFKAGNRPDLAEKEASELAHIETYLPKALSDAELERLVAQEAGALDVQGPKDMGRLMKAVLSKAAGRADGGRVQNFVKKQLQ
ncbi:MAG: GatB/YqeY domain-containing protein [Deltaproteobacteria bacterium]|nr:GatB/YqeY domain-containing protein [Deltaproteobacteria bacterium]